jgi:membrane fusion protein (multidrug efflux system)
MKNRFGKWFLACVFVAALLANLGCSQTPAARAPDKPSVEVVRVEKRDVPIDKEWIGTLDGLVNADIKAQVSGYLLRQVYMEGSYVTKGQLLFEIDPRPFQAVLDQAGGQLAQATGQLAQAKAQLSQAEAQVSIAEANQTRTQLDVDRYIPLAQQEAITQQDLDNATQNNLAAKAQVQAARAQVETARAQIQAANAIIQAAKAAVDSAQLNLGFTRLISPIDGVAGIAQQQVGALVSPASGAVTTVSTLNPIKCYFTVNEQEYLSFHRRYATQASLEAERKQMRLELVLSDGTVYGHPGSIFFADRQVNESTGAIRIAGLFPNPTRVLRPGQYGRIRTSIGTQEGALLVPQRSVSELQGNSLVAVVEAGNKIAIRPVKPGARSGNMWVIDQGLKPGEMVVAEGVQKVRPGMEVNVKSYNPPSVAAGR